MLNWLVGCLVGCLVGWLVGWLFGRLNCLLHLILDGGFIVVGFFAFGDGEPDEKPSEVSPLKHLQQSPSVLLIDEGAFDRPKKWSKGQLQYSLKSDEDLVILILESVPMPSLFLILLLFRITPGKVN